MFIMQFFYYQYKVWENKDSSDDRTSLDQQEELERNGFVEFSYEKVFTAVKLSKEQEVIPDDDALNFKDLKIGDDIYSLTFAAMID